MLEKNVLYYIIKKQLDLLVIRFFINRYYQIQLKRIIKSTYFTYTILY